MGSARKRIAILLLAVFGAAAGLFAQESHDLLQKGAALLRASRSAEAEAVLNSISTKSADYPAAQTLLGYNFLQRAALDRAEQAFQRALAVVPGEPTARFGLAVTWSRKGSLQEAAAEFEKFAEDPSLAEVARRHWVQTIFWLGKEEEAMTVARRLAAQYPSNPEFQSLLGFFSQARGETANARQAFERALELDPRRLPDYLSLIAVCRGQNDRQAALRWIRQAIELDPNQPLLYGEMAAAYEELGQIREAEQARAEAERTLEAEVLYTRAAGARVAGRPGETERLLRQCLRANPRLSKAWTDLGEILRTTERPEEALRSFDRALSIDPSNSLARLGAAAALQERSGMGQISGGPNFSAKKEAARKASVAPAEAGDIPTKIGTASLLLGAARDLPDNPDMLAFLGRLQESSGNPEQALASYSSALRIDPLHVEALLGQAHHALAAGHIHQAVADFSRAAELESANMRAWRGLVQAYRESKDFRAAESACRQCLARNPEAPDCQEMMAYLKMETTDYQEAAELFQTVFRNGRASKDLLDSLAFTEMKLGRTEEAIRLFESSSSRYGADAWVYFNLGYLYQNRADIPSAIASYRRARQLSPQDAEINHNLAFALYLAKDYASALEPFKLAVRLRPSWGLAHFNLAMNYWQLRQYALALTHARIADEKGVAGAARVVQSLSANLWLGAPRTLTVYRPKKQQSGGERSTGKSMPQREREH